MGGLQEDEHGWGVALKMTSLGKEAEDRGQDLDVTPSIGKSH